MLIAPTRIEKSNQVFILGATPNNPALWGKTSCMLLRGWFGIQEFYFSITVLRCGADQKRDFYIGGSLFR